MRGRRIGHPSRLSVVVATLSDVIDEGAIGYHNSEATKCFGEEGACRNTNGHILEWPPSLGLLLVEITRFCSSPRLETDACQPA